MTGVTGLHQLLSAGQPDHDELGARVVPVYWSASQLLSKLDQKQKNQVQHQQHQQQQQQGYHNRGYDENR